MTKFHKTKWQDYKTSRHNQIDKTILSWLLFKKSLTKQLKMHCQNFQVKIIFTGWKKPYLSEAKLLKIPSAQFVYVREVELICDEKPWVVARTIIPKHTITYEKQLLLIGTKSLGEYIFNHPHHHRLNFQLAESGTNKNWGRRSVFLLGNKSLLVTEFFTEYFWTTINKKYPS